MTNLHTLIERARKGGVDFPIRRISREKCSLVMLDESDALLAIVRLLAERGVALHLAGSLGWRFMHPTGMWHRLDATTFEQAVLAAFERFLDSLPPAPGAAAGGGES